MSRDQQDGHGFGICVKGGKDAGKLFFVCSLSIKLKTNSNIDVDPVYTY